MAWQSSSQNGRSQSPGLMPRSRQMSTMTAPTGRRRTSAAISCFRGEAREAGILREARRHGGIGRLVVGRRDLP